MQSSNFLNLAKDFIVIPHKYANHCKKKLKTKFNFSKLKTKQNNYQIEIYIKKKLEIVKV